MSHHEGDHSHMSTGIRNKWIDGPDNTLARLVKNKMPCAAAVLVKQCFERKHWDWEDC